MLRQDSFLGGLLWWLTLALSWGTGLGCGILVGSFWTNFLFLCWGKSLKALGVISQKGYFDLSMKLKQWWSRASLALSHVCYLAVLQFIPYKHCIQYCDSANVIRESCSNWNEPLQFFVPEEMTAALLFCSQVPNKRRTRVNDCCECTRL